MRILLVLAAALVGCSSENVQPLSKFGPIGVSIDVDLGPLPPGAGDLDVNPRVFVAFDHDNPACPVFGDVDTSIDGVRPDAFEHGYYDDGSGYGDNHDPSCQPPYYAIDKVPPAKPLSTLRLRDSTADFSLDVDRLFVNPAMTIATPLMRGQVARIDVNDDRVMTKVAAMWWVGNSESATGYDVMATVSGNTISFTMPTQVSGPGWLEVRVGLAAPQLTCNGFSMCSATIAGSSRFDGTLL